MKKTPFVGAALLAVSLPFAVSHLRAATQSFDGTLSDSMCGRKHMMPGKSDADCTKECVKEGSDYVLATDKAIYTLAGKPSLFEPFAGKKVHLQGELNKTTITVTNIRQESR